MKKRHRRLSPHCSRTSLRKHSTLALLLFLIFPGALFAQSTKQSFELNAGHLRATISVSNPPATRIIDSLHDGLESEIQYNVRVYERTGGLLGILGDKLVGDFERTYRATWDEFGSEFVVTRKGSAKKRIKSANAFLSAFFHLHGARTGIRLKPPHHYYVLSSVRIQIVKLVPPLTMISPFLSHREIDTPWVKTEITPK